MGQRAHIEPTLFSHVLPTYYILGLNCYLVGYFTARAGSSNGALKVGLPYKYLHSVALVLDNKVNEFGLGQI